MSMLEVRRVPEVTVALLVALVMVTLVGVPARATTSDLEAVAERLFFELINADRQDVPTEYAAEHDAVPPLAGYADIRSVARGWSEQMSQDHRLYHNPELGDQLCCWTGAAENVGVTSLGAADDTSLEDAVEGLHRAFMASEGHRRNLMNGAYDHVGVGVTVNPSTGRLWATMNFRTWDRRTAPDGDFEPLYGAPILETPDLPAPDLPTPDPVAAPVGGPTPRTDEDRAAPRRGVRRHAGQSRTATAAALSRATFDTSDVVLLARMDSYADALAGGPLAAALDAPVLLTPPGGLDAATRREIARLGATRAIVLGGTTAVHDSVVRALERDDLTVERIAGTSRFATATAIADRVVAETGRPATAWVVEGANADPTRGWPDALSAAAAAAQLTEPVLLATRDQLPTETAAWLAAHRPGGTLIVGGDAAVSDTVADRIRGVAGAVQRLAGPDRFATSVAVAEHLASRTDGAAGLYVATGQNWPDALAAGPAAAATDGLLLLVDGASAEGGVASQQYATSLRGRVGDLHVIGGEGAVAEPVSRRFAQLLGLEG